VTPEEEMEQAHQDVSVAIEKLARLLGAEGVIGEWTTVVAFQSFGSGPGDSSTQIVRLFPDDVPYHRSMGLLDYALTRMRANIGRLDNDDDD